GLVPYWANDEKIGNKMINARSETAHEKTSFKQLMAKKRCLIVADSFSERQKTDNGKQPKRIQSKHHQLFAFAGLWDKWNKGDKKLHTFTMLRWHANSFMKVIN